MRSAPDVVHLALRSLLRSPGVSLICVLALGLGIGATTAIFAFVDKLLLDPFPFPQDRLVMVLEASPERDREPVTAAIAEAWAGGSRTFAAMAAYRWWEVNLTGVNEPEHLIGYQVSPELFATLGVLPSLGRGFAATEGQAGQDRVVVLSDGLWRRRFGGDPGILGKSVLLDGAGYTVIGVMPASFRFPKAAALWAPLVVTDSMRAALTSHLLYVVGRLGPGASLAAARAELASISARFDADHPAHRGAHRPEVFALRDYGDPQTRLALWIMAAAVGMTLLLACANVANVLLARATARSREFALKIALGAPRRRIIAQLLVEGLLLALGACVVGLVLGEVGIHLLRAGMPPSIERFVAGWDRVGLDWRLFAFGGLASLVAALVSTSYAAVEASRKASGQSSISEGPRATGDREGHRRRSVLVLVQVALALVLVNDAGLLVQTLRRLLVAPMGFDPGHVLTFRVGVAPALAPDEPAVRQRLQDALSRVGAVPGVEQVGLASALPLSGRWGSTDFEVEGRAPSPDGRSPHAVLQVISEAYLSALRIPLHQGRSFGPSDAPGSLDVALVSEPFVQRHFPEGNVLGARVRIGQRWRTIVGVVGAVRHTEIADPGVAIYLPMPQDPEREVALAVRTAGEPLSTAGPVREALHAALPDQPISDLMPMAQVVDENARLAARYSAGLLGVLAGVALLLSAVGIYGVISQWVLQRVRELGIRAALGAGRRQLLGLVLSRGLRPVGLGAVLGLALALGHGRALRALLFGVSPDDPLTLVTVLVTLVAVAAGACLLPARHAARTDPATVLRGD
ncbi:MAG TPA: ABC transporter permease [Myxococcaceae bacterium]|nr:ABC transporter permease [Myxococcaceae bacterium]